MHTLPSLLTTVGVCAEQLQSAAAGALTAGAMPTGSGGVAWHHSPLFSTDTLPVRGASSVGPARRCRPGAGSQSWSASHPVDACSTGSLTMDLRGQRPSSPSGPALLAGPSSPMSDISIHLPLQPPSNGVHRPSNYSSDEEDDDRGPGLSQDLLDSLVAAVDSAPSQPRRRAAALFAAPRAIATAVLDDVAAQRAVLSAAAGAVAARATVFSPPGSPRVSARLSRRSQARSTRLPRRSQAAAGVRRTVMHGESRLPRAPAGRERVLSSGEGLLQQDTRAASIILP